VGIHEHGHAFGLDHENDIMATLNAFYPNSGVIGNGNETQPHSDDTYAVRVGYGTAVTSRDLAASAFRRTGAGTSDVIPAPAGSDRNARVSFPFTISNRGTTNQTSVQVRFYLSADRNITTADTFLGSATFNLNAGVTTTPTANVTIPSTAPTGNLFLGWIVDPLNAVAESDEANNGVGLTATTNIRTNRAPSACFTPTNSFGPAPLPVSFSASCSSDADGNPLTYTWNFGDGTTGTGVNPFHLYYDSGYYSVTLTVRDSTGATATAFGYVNVSCSSGGFGELCPAEP
jgi:PKD repeat protein